MTATATDYERAVAIGGGLLGLEAANGLMLRGMQVTVVQIMPWLMERKPDHTAGKLLPQSLKERGLKFLMGAQTQAQLPDAAGRGNVDDTAARRIGAVRFKDGTEMPADLVVMAAGIRPNTALAEKAGTHCYRGIVVNDTPQTITGSRRGGAAVRTGQGLRDAPRAVGHRPLRRQPDQPAWTRPKSG